MLDNTALPRASSPTMKSLCLLSSCNKADSMRALRVLSCGSAYSAAAGRTSCRDGFFDHLVGYLGASDSDSDFGFLDDRTTPSYRHLPYFETSSVVIASSTDFPPPDRVRLTPAPLLFRTRLVASSTAVLVLALLRGRQGIHCLVQRLPYLAECPHSAPPSRGAVMRGRSARSWARLDLQMTLPRHNSYLDGKLRQHQRRFPATGVKKTSTFLGI